MPKSAKKIIISLTLLVGVFFVFHLVFAQVNLGMEYGNATGLAATDPRIIIGRIIQIFLGFLGIIAVGLIIYGGFLWMTAAGNEEQIERAKKTLVSAIIGLAIILSAFAIATFILNQLLGATGAGGGNNNGGGGGPGGGINGAGVIGECSVQNVYPTPYQLAVPRNTAIFITFKEAVVPSTICASVDKNGNCATPSTINTTNIQIYKSTDKGNPLLDTKVLSSQDHKTYTFIPANYLGANTYYTVDMLGGILKASDQTSAFAGTGCAGSLSWQFQTSDLIDLTPPQVLSSGVFPPPDNGRDSANLVLSVRAVGSITVSSANRPQIFVAATSTADKTNTASPTLPADTTVAQNLDSSATIYVTVLADGLTATATTNDGTNLGSATFNGRTVSFGGKYPFSLTCSGDVKAGFAWTVNLHAARQADSLQVGSMVYTFVKESGAANEISIGAAADTAKNIADALNRQTEVTAEISGSGNQVKVSAAAAGKDGNNISLIFNSPTNTGALTTVKMGGGVDGSNVPDPNVNTAGNQPDQPMNTVIQINFNKPILPTNVVGDSSDVSAIQVVDASGNVVAGKFAIANLYKTVEFTSDSPCGVNGCGETIYCLPSNSHLTVKIKAASLAHCDTNADCVADSIAGKSFDQCIDNICSENLGGNNAAPPTSAPEVRRYPFANIQASPSGGPDGVTDAAFNSLDGDRNGYAEGAAVTYNDNPPIYSNDQNCQNYLEKIVAAAEAKRIAANKILEKITGNYCSSCVCRVGQPYSDAALCVANAASNMALLGIKPADLGGKTFIFDENEDEIYTPPTPPNACVRDHIDLQGCDGANFPTYYCTNGDNFSWSFFVNQEMDISAPVVTLVSPAANEVPQVSQDIRINFSKLMMASTLITGSTVFDNGKTKVTHKNINLWNVTSNPVGYWIQTETLFGGNSPVQTNAIIKHGDFSESSDYRAQAGSAVRDIHENCFKPSGDQATCAGVSEAMPSCCPDATGKLVPTATLDANGNCP